MSVSAILTLTSTSMSSSTLRSSDQDHQIKIIRSRSLDQDHQVKIIRSRSLDQDHQIKIIRSRSSDQDQDQDQEMISQRGGGGGGALVCVQPPARKHGPQTTVPFQALDGRSGSPPSLPSNNITKTKTRTTRQRKKPQQKLLFSKTEIRTSGSGIGTGGAELR